MRRLCLSRVGTNETEQRIMVGGWTDIMVLYSNASSQKGQAGKQSLKLAWTAWRNPVYRNISKQQQQQKTHRDLDLEMEDFVYM